MHCRVKLSGVEQSREFVQVVASLYFHQELCWVVARADFFQFGQKKGISRYNPATCRLFSTPSMALR